VREGGFLPLLVAGSLWGAFPLQPPSLVGRRSKPGPREPLPRRMQPSRARQSNMP